MSSNSPPFCPTRPPAIYIDTSPDQTLHVQRRFSSNLQLISLIVQVTTQGIRGLSMQKRWVASQARTGLMVANQYSTVAEEARDSFANDSSSIAEGISRDRTEDAFADPMMSDSNECDSYQEDGHDDDDFQVDHYEEIVLEDVSPVVSCGWKSPEVAENFARRHEKTKLPPTTDSSGNNPSQYSEQNHGRSSTTPIYTPYSRKRQRSHEVLLDEDTLEARKVGQMHATMTHIAEETSKYALKLQKLANGARMLSEEASAACEHLRGSPSFSPLVDAKYFGISTSYHVQEPAAKEALHSECTPANSLKVRSALPTPPTSRFFRIDSHGSPMGYRRPRGLATEEQSTPENPLSAFIAHHSVPIDTSEEAQHIKGGPAAEDAINKESPNSDIFIRPTQSLSVDAPSQFYLPCTNCAPEGSPCNGRPDFECNSCTTQGLTCIYDDANRIHKRDLTMAQLLLITHNPFRKPTAIAGRMITKTDAEWEGLAQKRKEVYLRCLDLERGGGIDVMPPCEGCKKNDVRCRAPGQFNSYGKANKRTLMKGNAKCSRCLFTSHRGGCSLNVGDAFRCWTPDDDGIDGLIE